MNFPFSVPNQFGGTPITDSSIKDRLIAAGTELFAEQGFAGTSVREICARADASVPMISHYFGNKRGLLDAVIGQLSSSPFEVPIRIIKGDLKSREEFLVKLDLFISETFNTLVDLAPVFRIIAREGAEFGNLRDVHAALAYFLERAQASGFLRDSLRPQMVTGLVLDRLGNQVMFAVNPNYKGPSVIQDQAYREEWLKANIDALLFGLAGQE